MISGPERGSGRLSISTALGGDHDEIDRALADVLGSAQVRAWETARVRLAELIRRLRRHVEVEETTLFPLFDERLRTVGPTRILRQEHRRLTGAFSRMMEAVRDRSIDGVGAAIRCIDEVLPHHVAKEESIIYPAIDRVLSDEEQESVVTRIDHQLHLG